MGFGRASESIDALGPLCCGSLPSMSLRFTGRALECGGKCGRRRDATPLCRGKGGGEREAENRDSKKSAATRSRAAQPTAHVRRSRTPRSRCSLRRYTAQPPRRCRAPAFAHGTCHRTPRFRPVHRRLRASGRKSLALIFQLNEQSSTHRTHGTWRSRLDGRRRVYPQSLKSNP